MALLFAGPAGVRGDADGGGAVGVILCWGHGGDGRGVVGEVSPHVVRGGGGGVDSASDFGVAGDTWWLACLVVV